MRTTAVVIGAGHAGLAMSRCLAERSIDHVVLERGEVANSWKTERWDSLRLLTPNWQSRLPGFGYEGDEPDGFRDMAETIAFIERYAASISAPVRTHTPVTSVRSSDGRYRVTTDRGTWTTRALVIASGACNVPIVPPFASAVPRSITQVTAMEYRNPSQVAEGGVLVVGASATGTQIADELHRSGRPVTLSVGGHARVPSGVVDAPGAYLMGIPFLRRRKSSLIDGAADYARDLSAHLAGFLDEVAAPA